MTDKFRSPYCYVSLAPYYLDDHQVSPEADYQPGSLCYLGLGGRKATMFLVGAPSWVAEAAALAVVPKVGVELGIGDALANQDYGWAVEVGPQLGLGAAIQVCHHHHRSTAGWVFHFRYLHCSHFYHISESILSFVQPALAEPEDDGDDAYPSPDPEMDLGWELGIPEDLNSQGS